jgi:Ca2+-binding EF-hand superfamily protein
VEAHFIYIPGICYTQANWQVSACIDPSESVKKSSMAHSIVTPNHYYLVLVDNNGDTIEEIDIYDFLKELTKMELTASYRKKLEEKIIKLVARIDDAEPQYVVYKFLIECVQDMREKVKTK